MTIGEEELHDAIEDLAARPSPPTSIDAPSAIVRGRRIVRRRRVALAATTTAVAGGTAVILAFAVFSAHGTNAHVGNLQQPVASSALSRPPGPGSDPLTASGAFGWLPANAPNAGYSLYDSQVQAVARGSESIGGAKPMIWLTIYPKGTTPTLDKFANGAMQWRVDAPDVNGLTAYWLTDSPNDPTNGGYPYLRWQSADRQWGELHGEYLATPSVTAEMLRIAAGVDFTPHAVPLPLWISGLPSSTVTTQADLNRPSLSGMSPWDLQLVMTIDAATVDVSVMPASAAPHSTSPYVLCKTASDLTACVTVDKSAGLPSSLSGGAAQILKNINLLGLDPANWTTAVLQESP